MGWWRKSDSRSEYEGRGPLKNTLFPKGADSLTNSDRLRLDSITGQDTDPLAEPDQYHWYGNNTPDSPQSLEAQAILRDQAITDPYPRGY